MSGSSFTLFARIDALDVEACLLQDIPLRVRDGKGNGKDSCFGAVADEARFPRAGRPHPQALRVGGRAEEPELLAVGRLNDDLAVVADCKRASAAAVRRANALDEHILSHLAAVAQLVADGCRQRGAEQLRLRQLHRLAVRPHGKAHAHRQHRADEQHDQHRTQRFGERHAAAAAQFFHGVTPDEVVSV